MYRKIDCVVCGKRFRKNASNQLCCSDRCIKKRTKELRPEYYRKNREHTLKVMRTWQRNNPEKYKAIKKREQRKHLADYLRRGTAWVKRNPDKVRKARMRRYWAHPENAKAVYHKRRFRIYGNGGSFTGQEFKALCRKYNFRCICCRRRRALEADHVIPLCKGGTSFINNIQPLCRSCNSRKGSKVIEYRRVSHARNQVTTERW